MFVIGLHTPDVCRGWREFVLSFEMTCYSCSWTGDLEAAHFSCKLFFGVMEELSGFSFNILSNYHLSFFFFYFDACKCDSRLEIMEIKLMKMKRIIKCKVRIVL